MTTLVGTRGVVVLNGKYNSVEEYSKANERIAEVYSKISDIEKRYLFLVGMNEHASADFRKYVH